MTETAWNKFASHTLAQCHYAIRDIHNALNVTCKDKDHSDPYVQKLWCELDAARDRIRELELASK